MKATSALFSIALLTSSTLILNLDENIQVSTCSWTGVQVKYLTFYRAGGWPAAPAVLHPLRQAGGAGAGQRGLSEALHPHSGLAVPLWEAVWNWGRGRTAQVMKVFWRKSGLENKETLKVGDGGDGGLAGGGVEASERPWGMLSGYFLLPSPVSRWQLITS